MGNPIGPRNPSESWTRTVRKAWDALGSLVGSSEAYAAEREPEQLTLLKETISEQREQSKREIPSIMTDVLTGLAGGALVAPLTRKAALGQAARGWRNLLRGAPEAEKAGLKAERPKMVRALAKMSKESLESVREVSVLPRKGTTKAGMGYKGEWFGKLFYYPGKVPRRIGADLVEIDPLESISHEVLGHLQALTPAKAGKFKKFFRGITKELAKGDPGAHERFADRMGVLTERYHKMKPGPMTLEDVKVLTEMATTETAWRPELAPLLRPMGRR